MVSHRIVCCCCLDGCPVWLETSLQVGRGRDPTTSVGMGMFGHNVPVRYCRMKILCFFGLQIDAVESLEERRGEGVSFEKSLTAKIPEFDLLDKPESGFLLQGHLTVVSRADHLSMSATCGENPSWPMKMNGTLPRVFDDATSE